VETSASFNVDRMLTFAIKHWAKRNEIKNASLLTLNSLSLCILTQTFMASIGCIPNLFELDSVVYRVESVSHYLDLDLHLEKAKGWGRSKKWSLAT
jgi:hypothetical protein